MDVNSATDTAAATTSFLTSSQNSLGQDDFLTLLVAQLQHQDPLDPQENSEFIAQMAQFSSLEQQVNTNDKLDALVSAQSNVEQMSAFSLLGQKVIVASGDFYMQGDSVDLGFSLDGDAQDVSLDVLDEDGNVVTSFAMNDLQQGYNFVNWDGTDSSGKQLPEGLYSIKVNGTDSAGEDLSVQPLVKVAVNEVGIDSSGSILVTDAGNIPFSGISSVINQ
ncbi:flagellar hook assembly protein FlgD [Pelobacter seleniigenes]|uniref:flagellar hook assembly protein FlgD n=1 Tax=Pelobacter seleniigenes TaxID=407188 RepID=UPI00068A707E|nr:flagellar hook assembly protein FlgD [Pelobacter seleniigenes]